MESESPETAGTSSSQILLYVTLTLGLVALVRYLFTSSVPDNVPPFPAKPYPVLGHLPYLKNGLREQMKKWSESTGEIFSVYFGPKLIVVLNSYEIIHQAFIKHADTLSDRSPAALNNDPSQNKGIITTSGPQWKEQRTVTIHILRAFGMGKNILAEKVGEEVSIYLNELSKLSGKPTDPNRLTLTAISNIICSIIVGKRFEYDDSFFTEFLARLAEQFRMAGSQRLNQVFPFLQHLPGDLFEAKKRMKNYQHILTNFSEYFIKKRESEYDENNLDNFISAYLYEMKKLERQGKETTLDRKNLSNVLVNLFLAGSETTSTTILWFMVYMINFPEIQAKVFEEIKDVVGTERAPNMQDRTKLTYLNAAILETQRLSSIVPMSVPHYCNKDTTIRGYTIPAGTVVLTNLDAVLFSGDTWKDPMTFRPERFLDGLGNLAQPEQFIPFSIGRRACLGEAMAKMELYLYLSSLIQRFELFPAQAGQLPLRKHSNGITSPPVPFQARFVQRS